MLWIMKRKLKKPFSMMGLGFSFFNCEKSIKIV